MAQTYVRPELRLVPTPRGDSAAFWTGGRDGHLLVSRCASCTRFFHPPASACFRCRSLDVSPAPVSGRGTVATYTVNWQPWIPGFDPPYVIAMIELDEEPDVRIVSNVVGIDPAEVEIGMAVEVFFEEWGEVWVPLFRPLTSGTGQS